MIMGVFTVDLLPLWITHHRSTKSPVTLKRIQNIIEYLTFEVFRYNARGLYEMHKFMFTMLLALKIDMQSGKVKHQELQTLIKGRCLTRLPMHSI